MNGWLVASTRKSVASGVTSGYWQSKPQRQRSGIGTRLIAAAEQDCRSAGCRFMDLTFVNVRQELPAYYERFGYVENGTLPFPADQVAKIPVHLVRMSRRL